MGAEEHRDEPPDRSKVQANERGPALRPKSSAGGAPRPIEESRRRKPPERRNAGWGDGIDRAYCSRDIRELPLSFPVESHGGAATIAPAIVARRPDAVLLCTFTHHGPHEWPDGEAAERDEVG